jgi:hypothetical protein
MGSCERGWKKLEPFLTLGFFGGLGPAFLNRVTMRMFAGKTTKLLVIAMDNCFTEKLIGPALSSVPVDEVLSVWKNIAFANIVVRMIVRQQERR